MGKYSHVWSGVYTLFFFTCEKKVFFSQVKKKYSCFWHTTPTATTSTGLFLLQYTVSYSEDFFSRCEDFFPKQLSKTCGSYEKNFACKNLRNEG